MLIYQVFLRILEYFPGMLFLVCLDYNGLLACYCADSSRLQTTPVISTKLSDLDLPWSLSTSHQLQNCEIRYGET